ncbi:hypothetical protein APY94_00710 [Thermococcus celericrescens]|uniref:Uncharacterized protein n=1 Tax=Thermococcus celericrescens TaxID=227598 RepID=A0A117ITW7_9EURY|nr:hypothetical protein APY94_00710 [Thermococcus celericrescens]
MVFSAVASGCISGGGGEEETATIVMGVTDKVTDLDPSNAYDFYTWEVLNNVMEGLLTSSPP